MHTREPRYLAYMLRLWQVREAQSVTWHASLEEVETRRVRGFASLEALVSFLLEVMRGSR